jgi:hypothetical protein
MADTNESSEERDRTVFHPLPALKDPQSEAITAEIDALLEIVMQVTQTTPDQLQQFIERFKWGNDPQFLLDGKKRFLAVLLRKRKERDLPQACFSLLIRVAIYEVDPSFNRSFIEPGLRVFGYRKVQEALLEYVVEGTNREKAGAVRAFYWAKRPLLLPDWDERYGKRKWHNQEELAQAVQEHSYAREKALQAFQRMCEEKLGDLHQKVAHVMLNEFVQNEDLDVRRAIIPQLSLHPSQYLEEEKPLPSQAIQIASSHPDDYIRSRAMIQLKEASHTSRTTM